MKNKWSEWCLRVNGHRTQLNYKQSQANNTYWPWIKGESPDAYLFKTKRKTESPKWCIRDFKIQRRDSDKNVA